MTVASPEISVVIPAYNAERYIGEAIRSILAQTMRNIEVLVVNDGSTDRTLGEIEACRREDDRVVLIDEGKLGFVEALNTAIRRSRGSYIARMDADDVALPHRLARQKAFLDERPDIILCGSWARTFGQATSKVVRYPSDPDDLRCAVLFYSALNHPSVMIRRSLFSEEGIYYDPACAESADFGLWVRCARDHRLANVPEVLLNYRVHTAQVTQADAPRQGMLAKQIRLDALAGIGLAPTPRQLELHDALGNWRFTGDRAFVTEVGEWLEIIRAWNRRTRALPEGPLEGLLADYWFSTCTCNSQLGRWVHSTYFRSPLASGKSLPLRRRVRFFLKTLAAAGTRS